MRGCARNANALGCRCLYSHGSHALSNAACASGRRAPKRPNVESSRANVGYGIDVLYMLAGQRASQPDAELRLDESELRGGCRNAPAERRVRARRLLRSLAELQIT